MPPPEREIRTAGALILAAGLLAVALAILGERLGVGADVARGTFGWQRGMLLVAGSVAILGGAPLFLRPQLASRRIAWERMPTYLIHLALGLLILLGIALLWTRLIRLDQSFWHDEAFTVLNYSGVGPGAILFGEATFDINNHAAYNLLSWATAELLGTSEAIYRLWSVVPGIAAVGLGGWWAWRRLGAVTAVAFAALAVAAPMHLHLTPQARGYGLALLAAVLMLIAADRLTREYTRRMFVGFLGAGLLGIWTLFIFAIVFVGQAVALLRWPRLRRPAFVVVGVAGILSIAFYAPVLGGVLGAGAEGETVPETISLGAALTLNSTLEWLVAPIAMLFTGGDTSWWMGLALLPLVALAVIGLRRRGDLGLALLLLVPPLLFNLVFAIGGIETAERHQFPLLPHVLFLVAIGVAELGAIVARYRPLRPLAIGAGVMAVLALSVATVERQQRTTAPFEGFKEAAEIARWSGVTPIVTDSVLREGLRYYLGDDLLELWPNQVESLLCDPDQEVVYIRHITVPPEYWILWAPASLDCALERPSVHVRVPQRRAHTWLAVWIVGPRASEATVEDDLRFAPEP